MKDLKKYITAASIVQLQTQLCTIYRNSQCHEVLFLEHVSLMLSHYHWRDEGLYVW